MMVTELAVRMRSRSVPYSLSRTVCSNLEWHRPKNGTIDCIVQVLEHILQKLEKCGQIPEDSAVDASASMQRMAPSEEDASAAHLDDEVLEFPDKECRLVLVGKTGNGKSASANTILGLEGRFQASYQFDSTTRKCQRHNNTRFGIPLEVVDTPGLFDTKLDKDKVAKEVIKCLGVVAPGPHAIILVLRLGVRFTEEENKAVEEIHKLLRFLVIIFTHGDTLNDLPEDEKEQRLQSMLANSPEKLKELLDRTRQRYVVFDNKASPASKSQQVKQLLTTIIALLKVNGSRPYTNNMLRIAEQCMQERESELVDQVFGKRRRAVDRSMERFQCRDMAREEVVQEAPLLKRIMDQVLPILAPLLSMLFNVLVGTLVKKFCCIQ